MPAAYLVQNRRFALAAFRTGFSEAGADDQECLDALGDAVVNNSRHLIAWNGNDRERHVAVDGSDGLECWNAFNASAGWIDGDDSAAKSGGHEIVEDLRAEAAPSASSADHRDCRRPKERSQGCLCRRTRAQPLLLVELCGFGHRKDHVPNLAVDVIPGQRKT